MILRGESVAPGLAVGPVHLRGYGDDEVALQRIAADQVEDELNRLRDALQKSRAQIEEIKHKQLGQLGEALRQILGRVPVHDQHGQVGRISSDSRRSIVI